MNEGGAFLQKGMKNTSENTHEKRGGSFWEPVGEGDLNNSLYPQFSDFLGGSHGDIGLGARADLRSCSEWYLEKSFKNIKTTPALPLKRETHKNITEIST